MGKRDKTRENRLNMLRACYNLKVNTKKDYYIISNRTGSGNNRYEIAAPFFQIDHMPGDAEVDAYTKALALWNRKLRDKREARKKQMGNDTQNENIAPQTKMCIQDRWLSVGDLIHVFENVVNLLKNEADKQC